MGAQLHRPRKGTRPSNYRLMSTVAKQSPISAGTEVLFHEWVGLPLTEGPGMCDCGGNKAGLLMGVQSQQNNWKWHWQDHGSVGSERKNNLTMLYLPELKPSASGNDEKPINVLNNAIFLDIFSVSSSCWLPKVIESMHSETASHTSQTIDLRKVTRGADGTQCMVSCGRKTGECVNGVRWVTNMSAWTHTNLTFHILPIPATELWRMQTILCRPCHSFPVEVVTDSLGS